MILSDVFQGYAEIPNPPNPDDGGGSDSESSNMVLVIILVSLAIILVVGGIVVFIYLRKLKSKPMENVIIAKPTNLDDISGTNKGEKMLDSMAQSQAVENQ